VTTDSDTSIDLAAAEYLQKMLSAGVGQRGGPSAASLATSSSSRQGSAGTARGSLLNLQRLLGTAHRSEDAAGVLTRKNLAHMSTSQFRDARFEALATEDSELEPVSSHQRYNGHAAAGTVSREAQPERWVTSSAPSASERTPSVAAPPLLCGQCAQREVELECDECLEQFCASCAAQVHRRGRMAEHILRRPGELHNGSNSGIDSRGGPARQGQSALVPLTRRFFGCPSHPDEPLQYFCLSCEKECICSECCVHGEHRGHEVLKVQAAYTTLRPRIGDVIASLKHRVDGRHGHRQSTSRQRQDLSLVIDSERRRLREGFEQLREQINRKEAQLLGATDHCEQRAHASLQGLLAPTLDSTRVLREVLVAIGRAAEYTDEVKALNAYAAGRKEASEVLGHTATLKSVQHEVDELKDRLRYALESQVGDLAALSAEATVLRTCGVGVSNIGKVPYKGTAGGAASDFPTEPFFGKPW